MIKKKSNENRKEIKIRYIFDNDGKIKFIDPCSDELPLYLFLKIIDSLTKIQNEYNNGILNKQSWK